MRLRGHVRAPRGADDAGARVKGRRRRGWRGMNGGCRCKNEERRNEIEQGIGTAMGERQYGGCVTSVCINARCLPPLLEPRCRCCGIDPTTRNDFLSRGTRAPNETFNPKATVRCRNWLSAGEKSLDHPSRHSLRPGWTSKEGSAELWRAADERERQRERERAV